MVQKENVNTSGQDGGVGRHTLLAHITIRIPTNVKTKNNQNCQKIERYGSLTTKELKKKQSSRQVRGAELGSLGREDVQQGGSSGWRNRQSCIYMWQMKTGRDNWGASNPSPRPDCTAQGSNTGKIKPHNLCL